MEVVKVLEPEEVLPKRRVIILRREDGTFTYREQYYLIEEHEGGVISEGWESYSDRAGIYATAETAENEARNGYYRWFRTPLRTDGEQD